MCLLLILTTDICADDLADAFDLVISGLLDYNVRSLSSMLPVQSSLYKSVLVSFGWTLNAISLGG